jgi:uncharacterized delta-60 repeat protein
VGASLTYYPLIRLNSDGSLDNTFNLVASDSIGFYRARLLRTTSDGKLLTVSTSMARFNSDGTLDNTFTRLPFGDSSGNTNSYSECYWFEQLADGRLVIPSDPAIGTTTINGQPFNGAVRLLADGTLDPSFSQPAFQRDIFPTAIALGADGQLLVGGSFDHVGSIAKTGLARLTTAGGIDSSYTLSQSNVLSVLGLAPLQDDKSYALLQSGDVAFGAPSNFVALLQPDGTVAQQFKADPSSVNAAEPFFSDFLLQNGQPVVVGSRVQALLDQTNIPVVRLLADGKRDPVFQPTLPMPGNGRFGDGLGITDWSSVTINNIGWLDLGDAQLLAVLSNGELLVAIYPSFFDGSYAYQLIRLNSDGTMDSTFSGPNLSPVLTSDFYPVVTDRGGTVGQVYAIYPVRCLTAALVQSNGGTILSGTFTNVNGTFRSGIARLKADSSLDLAFPVGAGPTTLDGVAPVAISGVSADTAGRIWVTGNFVKWDGIAAPGYVRLNQDGTVDTNCLPQSSHYPVNDFVASGLSGALPTGTFVASGFSGALPNGTGQCYVFGPAMVPGASWPNPLSRLVGYPPPTLYAQGLLSGSRFGMGFNSESGQSYWLQASPDLVTWTNWLQIQGTGNPMFFTDSVSAILTRNFYRVVYQ